MDIPLPGNKSINVLLTQHKIHSDDFELTITDETGKHRIAMNEGHYYYGVIENGTRTMAAISIFENEISGIITDERGNWNLGQHKIRTADYVFFNDHTFQLPIQFSCSTEDVPESGNKNGGGSNSTFGTQFQGNCAKVFFDCSNSFYQTAGSNSTNVTNHTNAIFNVMNTIYGNDSITISIGSIHIWVTIDPFNYASNGDALNSFRNWWNANGGRPGDIAALLSTQAGLGGGVAWVNSICVSNTFSYSFNRIDYGSIGGFPTYSWDVNLVAHECGHNFGSNHTHWCGWVGGPIDNCNSCWNPVIPNDGGPCTNGSPPPSNGGTIMSYCHGCPQGVNFANGFGYQPANRIRTSIAAASCINVCTSCNTNLSLSGTHFSYENQSWWATNEIIGVNILQQSGSYLNFNAGVDVLLQPNFEVQAGATFHASVGCTPSVRIANTTTYSSNYLKLSEPLGNLIVSPNPFTGQLKVAFELIGDAAITISIMDQTGRLVFSQVEGEVLLKGRQEVNLNTSNLSAGMYYIRVQSGDKLAVKKVVKL